ncbi:MAG: ABC transporter permease [Candidatus Tectomicrobia bacterium]|nr:ABC transporter permease [Candidatus Tectomicrobia bacterium]
MAAGSAEPSAGIATGRAEQRGLFLARLLRHVGRYYPLAVLVLLWEALGRFGLVDELTLPSVQSVAHAFADLLGSGEIFGHIATSAFRALTSFIIVMVVGIPLGLIWGLTKRGEEILDRLISFAYPIPKVALIPLFILWLGIGELSKLAIIIVAAIFPLLVNTYAGVKGTSKHLVWSALSMGATRQEIFRRIIFPSTLPHIFTGLRLAMGVSWILLFSAEMLASDRGLGFLTLMGENELRTDVVLVGLICIGGFGFGCDRLLRLLSRRLCHWYFAMGFEKGDR